MLHFYAVIMIIKKRAQLDLRDSAYRLIFEDSDDPIRHRSLHLRAFTVEYIRNRPRGESAAKVLMATQSLLHRLEPFGHDVLLSNFVVGKDYLVCQRWPFDFVGSQIRGLDMDGISTFGLRRQSGAHFV